MATMNQLPSFPRKMPIGIQSFEKLRRENYVYIDKTEIMYRLVSTSNPYFLSRPRRFGKSLLLSTMEAYFLGKRDLFKGLAIERLETEWNTHAVLHLDLNAEKYDSPERLHDMLERQLRGWEKTYETKTGRGVVVLIDEYDKPLLNSFHDEALQKAFRETLTAFYTVLKSADQWLRFVFITGVTKFAQMGIFSNLNQLKDISLDPRYAALCGLTGDEIRADFVPELKLLAKENNLDDEACMERLTRMYDGYHFNYRDMVGIYNPFSILNVLDSTMFENYWFATGTPSFLTEILKKTDFDFDLRELDGIEVSAASLSDDRANINNPVPMIYQSGYLTIKKYDERFQIYTLGFPNDEVKYGFLNFVTPFYTPVAESETSFYIGKFIHELESGDVDAFLTRLRAFFAGISYELNNRTERHYQTIFYLVFKLMGQFAETEVRSAKGRADAVVKTADYIYVFEFK
ncbi:MAG: AAA family ATPase, partial [Butyricimonas synergistica]